MMTSTETRSISALWYAWGQIDSGKYPTLTLDDGFEFQRQQTKVAEDYYAEHVGMMPSILQAWAEYVAVKASK
jgi:hypothetical protein